MIKRKKLIIDNMPVTITIHEEDLTTHEKLLIILDAIKMQIDAEFEEYIANNDKAKTIEYKVLTEYIYNLKKTLKEQIEFESHQRLIQKAKRKKHKY